MTSTPSSEERDGEVPPYSPIIDEVHLFTPKPVGFKRGLGRGFLIYASNAGPVLGTKMHAALEDYIQAEGPLKPGAYTYSAATGRWAKAPNPEDLEGISHISFTAEVPAADPEADQIAAVTRARFTRFDDLVGKTIGLDDNDLKVPYYTLGGAPTPEHSSLRAYRENSAAYLSSKENTVSDDTNTKAPTDIEAPLQAPPWAQRRGSVPRADEISVCRTATYRRGQESESLGVTIEVDTWVERDEEANPAYLVAMPGLYDTSKTHRATVPEAKVVDYLTSRREGVKFQYDKALERRDRTRKAADEAQKKLEIASLHSNILGNAIDDFVQKRAARDDRRAAEQEAEIKRALYRPAEPDRARSIWRPTFVTFKKYLRDLAADDGVYAVRYTAVREMEENHWSIAGQRDRFTWDELLDWIQSDEDDLDKVMSQVRYQHLMDKVTYRAAKVGVVQGFGWVEDNRS